MRFVFGLVKCLLGRHTNAIAASRGWRPLFPVACDRCRSLYYMGALLLLALPLAAQSPQIGGFDGIRTINISPAGTWEAETTRVVQGTEVTDHGTITLKPDGTYQAARKWTWLADGIRTGLYAYIEGTWRTEGPSPCVKREDGATEVCQPFTATPHTLRWGVFTFTGSAE